MDRATKQSIGEGPLLSRVPALVNAQSFLANFTEALLLLDENWRIQYANPLAARMFGRTQDQLASTTLWAQWPSSIRAEIERQHRLALHEQRPVELQHPTEGEKWLELHAFSCELGFVAYYHDLTEQNSTSELQQRLAAIVESSDDAIIGKDLNGIIQSWNRGAERIFGYKADEIIGKHISTLAAPEVIDEIPGILKRIAQGERVDHYQTKRKTKDGRILTLSLTVSPIRDASGAVMGASKVARDITERERQEEALRKVNAALTRSNADLQQFAYSASHDLQEPLRMVATYSDMLQRKFGGKLGPSGDEYIRYTIEGALRMEQLLRDLRAYTQASTMEQEPTEDIDAGKILDQALLNLDTAIKDSGASIARSDLPLVRLHEFQLQQLFQNLIGNAIRYRTDAPPKIQVAARRQGKEWLFSVQDNGIGIDPQYKEQVFGIFKRLHSTAEYPGTGMGLAICQRIVERAGGRIWVESQPGQGSTFFFTVPCKET
jgi:PAS domain S-box-containing protein